MTVLVVIPTYNERENLPLLVPAVLAHGYQVLIVDDGSPDGTGQVADALSREHPEKVSVLHRNGLKGLGRSYLEAFSQVIRSNADVICQMDADLSHDPKHLPEMVSAVTEQFDLVIGSRYLEGGAILNWPWHRILLSSLANGYIRRITALSTLDCTSGFRCWRRDVLARLPLERIVSDGYSFLVETLFEAERIGCRIGEVPIVFVERRRGRSKLTFGVLFESLITPWRMILRRNARE